MHDKNDPMGLIQEDPELFVRPKLDDGKQKSFLPGGGGGGPRLILKAGGGRKRGGGGGGGGGGCLNLNAGRKEINGNVLNFGSDQHPWCQTQFTFTLGGVHNTSVHGGT